MLGSQRGPGFAPSPLHFHSASVWSKLSTCPENVPSTLSAVHGGLGTTHSPLPWWARSYSTQQSPDATAASSGLCRPLEVMRKRELASWNNGHLQSVCDQMQRRCFHELQTSAVPTATFQGLCLPPRTGKAASACFLEHSCFLVAEVSTTFSDYDSFCANYTEKIERMSLTLQRTQSRLA